MARQGDDDAGKRDDGDGGGDGSNRGGVGEYGNRQDDNAQCEPGERLQVAANGHRDQNDNERVQFHGSSCEDHGCCYCRTPGDDWPQKVPGRAGTGLTGAE
ncbi:hypothetical protein D3C81_1876550 [compost metagenome]